MFFYGLKHYLVVSIYFKTILCVTECEVSKPGHYFHFCGNVRLSVFNLATVQVLKNIFFIPFFLLSGYDNNRWSLRSFLSNEVPTRARERLAWDARDRGTQPDSQLVPKRFLKHVIFCACVVKKVNLFRCYTTWIRRIACNAGGLRACDCLSSSSV